MQMSGGRREDRWRRSIPTHVTFAIRPVAPTAVSRLAFRSYYEVNQGNKAL